MCDAETGLATGCSARPLAAFFSTSSFDEAERPFDKLRREIFAKLEKDFSAAQASCLLRSK